MGGLKDWFFLWKRAHVESASDTFPGLFLAHLSLCLFYFSLPPLSFFHLLFCVWMAVWSPFTTTWRGEIGGKLDRGARALQGANDIPEEMRMWINKARAISRNNARNMDWGGPGGTGWSEGSHRTASYLFLQGRPWMVRTGAPEAIWMVSKPPIVSCLLFVVALRIMGHIQPIHSKTMQIHYWCPHNKSICPIFYT